MRPWRPGIASSSAGRSIRARLLVVLGVGMLIAACGSSGETLSPPATIDTGTPTTAPVPGADAIQPCDLISETEVSELLGVGITHHPLPPDAGALACDLLTTAGEPVVRLWLATGFSGNTFNARVASRLLPGEDLRAIATSADLSWWNAGRRILVALRADVMIQVLFIGPRFAEGAEASAAAQQLVDLLVAGVNHLNRGPQATPGPAPQVVALPRPDPEARSFEDNLLAKVEAGEWTLGQGLAATLRYLAGEVPDTQVLRDPASFSGFENTGIIAMAYDYVADGSDDAAKAEIRRLLGRLVLTPDRLAAMAGSRPTAAGEPASVNARLASWSTAETNPVEDCASFYEGTGIPNGVGDCLQVEVVEAGGSTFWIYFPDVEGVDAGWSGTHIDLIKRTIADSVPVYTELGSLPRQIVIVLSAGDNDHAAMQAIQPTGLDWCTVTMFQNVLASSAESLRFNLAHEFGHCFQNATIPDQQVPYHERRWREEGFAEYLASVVYPDLNNEDRFVDDFLTYEVSEVTVGSQTPREVFAEGGSLVRSYENVVWFNSLRDAVGGTEALIRLLGTGPTEPGIERQIAFLQGIPGIEELHHNFHLDVADGHVFDVDGREFPPGTEVNGGWFVTPTQEVALWPAAFGVAKWELTVEAGKVARMSLDPADAGNVLVSARPSGDSTGWFPLQDGSELEATCDADGVYIVVATRTNDTEDPKYVTLSATDVVDLEDCGGQPTPPVGTSVAFDTCLVGEWQMDLKQYASMRKVADQIMAAATSLTVDGSVRLKVDPGGTVTLTISDYHELDVWDVGDLTTTSSGQAQGRWETNGSVMRATWPRIEFSTTISGYVGTSKPNGPPVDILQGPDVAGYRCEAQQLSYVYPPIGPIQRWTRISS